MKSLICPKCGCIAHVPEQLENHVKDHNNCEMCGSGAYLYDQEIEPFTFPGDLGPSEEIAGQTDGIAEQSELKKPF